MLLLHVCLVKYLFRWWKVKKKLFNFIRVEIRAKYPITILRYPCTTTTTEIKIKDHKTGDLSVLWFVDKIQSSFSLKKINTIYQLKNTSKYEDRFQLLLGKSLLKTNVILRHLIKGERSNITFSAVRGNCNFIYRRRNIKSLNMMVFNL